MAKATWTNVWVWTSLLTLAFIWNAHAAADQIANSSSQDQPTSQPACNCECQYRKNNCPQFKQTVMKDEDRENIGPCTDSPKAYQKVWTIMRGCSHGGFDSAWGQIKPLFSMGASLITGPSRDDVSLSCEQSILGRYTILKPVIHTYTPEMQKIMLEKWSCGAIAREVNTKMQILDRQIEEKRLKIRDDLVNEGKPDIGVDDPLVEARLKSALTKTERTYLQDKGPPQKYESHWACYTPEAKARFWCEGLFNGYLALSGVAGISKMAAMKDAMEAKTAMAAASETGKTSKAAATEAGDIAKLASLRKVASVGPLGADDKVMYSLASRDGAYADMKAQIEADKTSPPEQTDLKLQQLDYLQKKLRVARHKYAQLLGPQANDPDLLVEIARLESKGLGKDKIEEALQNAMKAPVCAAP